MTQKTAFEKFAPAILQVFHRNREAFWAAIMAPFLVNQTTFVSWLQNARVDIGLLSAFKGLDDQAKQVLRDFSAPLGLDVTTWESNRLQYFKDAYPVFAFLAVWMDEEGLDELLENFVDILRAGVYAVAGYGILDVNVDSRSPSPVEILTAQALISEYETLALRIFGISRVNLDIMQRMRTLFLEAEIREKSMRGVASPYRLDKPEELGAKGANSVTPFMLSLERLGKAALVDDYWEVFLLFGAAIQMIDDWNDLEDDLANGHYSYVTLGVEYLNLHDDPGKTARILREDQKHIRDTYTCSKEMIARARLILDRLKDPCLVRFVDVTEARLDVFFQKELKMA
ncbi:hypothetical protein [Leptolinea tardivitalis]|uniref:Terpene synthase n=1 Tax=Leptolinea tardivitalis TaxID=229920 RepID=A0A0N8GM18_9CHLR|nr:hypothetical protein [Leptolinea tardivitalis]KPL74058.1 hypothetical protein ADM99_02160 [Leptolinea tardivitalis]GAP22701.1 hypothetical protein LTAR_02940 [Leptolinea tardivitalis]